MISLFQLTTPAYRNMYVKGDMSPYIIIYMLLYKNIDIPISLKTSTTWHGECSRLHVENSLALDVFYAGSPNKRYISTTEQNKLFNEPDQTIYR